MSYTPRPIFDPVNGYGQPDEDLRPKTHPCRWCARDVEKGTRCICIPSQPSNREKSLTIAAC